MKNIKVITIVLALCTSTAFADFTIKDLFVSGGTSKPVDKSKTDDSKDKDSHKKHDCEDCH